MTEIKLGDYNNLTVTRTATRENSHSIGGVETFGIFLDGGREGEILMPQKYVPDGTKVGDSLRCFVYLDQEERLIATTETPLARVGEFAYLKCQWVNQYGAFLGWGVMKDVFCPFKLQKRPMEVGESYIVYLYVDPETHRITATARIDKLLNTQQHHLKKGEPVHLLVWQKSPLGFKVIVDNAFSGIIYQNRVFQPLHTGDSLQGWVEQVRPDGKLDITLRPLGKESFETFADTLKQWMEEHNGFCPMTDDAHPNDVKQLFHVSKKVFKRAISHLYKQRIITIEEDGLHLV